MKVVAQGLSATPRMPEHVARGGVRPVTRGTRDAFFGEAGWLPTPVVARGDLGERSRPGPLIIEEYDTTIVVRPGWAATLDGWNNVVLRRQAA